MDWQSQVCRAREGDVEAYGALVRRFTDMACGYAYSLLGDFHLAEDAAQEAFVQAYRDLSMLSNPRAFPGWLKRIVFKYCDRITRDKRPPLVSLTAAESAAGQAADPPSVAARHEMAERVRSAIAALPKRERSVATLFYVNGHSRRTIAEFLEVPLTTVDNRLQAARRRLRRRMAKYVLDEEMTRRIRENMDATEE
jgi:RNA polymerase sigma factor (sigma-70 family)